ncbi:hypothetical protein T484DRAFT_1863673, partial [Baffinella frigidus]
VEAAPSLEELSARENQIECMASVAGLTRLATLSLGVNRIATVKGLENLGALRSLELHNNLITTLPPGCVC